VEHFQSCGYELPAFMNPAEFLVDLTTIDARSEEAEQASYTRVQQLRKVWQQRSRLEPGSFFTPPVQSIGDGNQHRRVGFRQQFYVLVKRDIQVTVRDSMGIVGSIFGAIVMSIIVGLIYFRLGNDLTGIRSREGALYIVSCLQNYIILMFEIYRLTIDMKLFDRERNEGVVSVPAYLLSRRFSRLFLEDLPVPIIFGTIFYFMAGFRVESATFFIFLLITVISQFIAVTLASVCVGISRNFAIASWFGNLTFVLQTSCSGFLVQAEQIPVYVRWLKWIVSINSKTFSRLT
jgi:ABC-2 type transporter